MVGFQRSKQTALLPKSVRTPEMGKMNRCSRCALPDTFPGIEIYTDMYDLFAERLRVFRSQLKEEFNKIVDKARQQEGYHCILCYSGCKDSTFLLRLPKNGVRFESPRLHPRQRLHISQAFRNIAIQSAPGRRPSRCRELWGPGKPRKFVTKRDFSLELVYRPFIRGSWSEKQSCVRPQD